MSEEITRRLMQAPGKFLIDTGLIFELNRQVLNPFGLALTVGVEDEGATNVMGQFHIIDAREDQEGVVYDPESFIVAMQKLNMFLEQGGSAKLQERVEELGYVVQEFPDPFIKKNGVPLISYNPNHDPDDEESPDLVLFVVPFEWLEKELQQWYEYSVMEFLDMYTYDHTEPIYQEAKEDGVIIEEAFTKQ
jgi:hypothetical protein